MASQTTAAERKTNVFISYSRKDGDAADRLHAALLAQGFNPYLDKHDIAAGEDWKARLGGLIDTADTMVFLISPDSIASSVCDWEINHAELMGKRILPVMAREAENVPERLRRLNYVFMRTPEEEAQALPRLADALAVDIGWIRTHTRYGDDANEWNRAGRPGRLLLRGTGIGDAETWRDSRPPSAPQLTETQSAWIAASRRGATNRQRAWIAGSLAITAIAVGLSIYAIVQRQAAETNQRETIRVLASSDFRQGSALADDLATAPEGIAFLSRAARGGDKRAETRLWTMLQQRSFWVPKSDEVTPAGEQGGVPENIRSRFASVDFRGQSIRSGAIAVSADACCVLVVIGGVSNETEGPTSLWAKLFAPDGTTKLDWFELAGSSIAILDTLAALSPQGRYAAIASAPATGGSYLTLYDLLGQNGPVSLPIDRLEDDGFSTALAIFNLGRETDADEYPVLLIGTSEGRVTRVYNHIEGYAEFSVARHRAAVRVVAMDGDWVMSAGDDRSVLVTEPLDEVTVGGQMQVGEAVTAIRRVGTTEIAIDQATSLRSGFALQQPISLPYAGEARSDDILGDRQVPCWQRAPLNEVFLHPSGLAIMLPEPRQVVVSRDGLPLGTSPKFVANIRSVCPNAAGDAIAITTGDFRTEIWAADFSRRFGPAFDESSYFDANAYEPNRAWVQLSADGSTALLRSVLSVAPEEYVWLSLWDVPSGLPLVDRELHQEGSSDGSPVSSATLDGDFVAYLYDGEPTGRGLNVTVPPDLEGLLPDYMEALAGLTIDSAGLARSLPNRSEALTKAAGVLEQFTR